ncbi:MAG TPA: toll/interleukin-1 receptor domain-containing protein [Ktedonobacterales bacterium]|jgi:tetratricopeptide (TPR) repeat protein
MTQWAQAAQPLRVFVSFSYEDDAFCREVVQALRDAGADVWYDERELGSGQLVNVIQRELGSRPLSIVVLTKAAFASQEVTREVAWAYEMYSRDPSRLILPVLAGPIAREDFSPENAWQFLQDFMRIEAPGYQPYPPAEAAYRLLSVLGLNPPGEAPVPIPHLPAEEVGDLLARGKALSAQKQYAKALPLFERATQLAPDSFDAWANLGYILDRLERCEEALTVFDRALALNDQHAWVWINKGHALDGLGLYDEELDAYNEALAIYDRALVLNPDDAMIWTSKGATHTDLGNWQEALDAYERALALAPSSASAWANQGFALCNVGRDEEALTAFDHALALDPKDPEIWVGKGTALQHLKRYEEALAAYERALAVDPDGTQAWTGKYLALRDMGRASEAEAALQRARHLR